MFFLKPHFLWDLSSSRLAFRGVFSRGRRLLGRLSFPWRLLDCGGGGSSLLGSRLGFEFGHVLVRNLLEQVADAVVEISLDAGDAVVENRPAFSVVAVVTIQLGWIVQSLHHDELKPRLSELFDQLDVAALLAQVCRRGCHFSVWSLRSVLFRFAGFHRRVRDLDGRKSAKVAVSRKSYLAPKRDEVIASAWKKSPVVAVGIETPRHSTETNLRPRWQKRNELNVVPRKFNTKDQGFIKTEIMNSLQSEV